MDTKPESTSHEETRTGPAHDTNAPKAQNKNGLWVLIATILGSSMAFIDGTVVNVALPTLQTDLKADVSAVQWVVEAYSLLLAALILVGGSLGDRFGRRRIYTIGIIIFTLASIVCGLAPDILTLIIARAVQGIGGALLVPGSLAIISANFSGAERGRAIGTWSGFTSITSAFGPALGGWLIENVSWRAIFFLNVFLAIPVLLIVFSHVPESRNPNAKRLDWWGAVLAIVGLGGVVYGLIEGNEQSLTAPVVLVALTVGIVSLILFVVVEIRSHHPMMPLHLFSSRTFSGTNLLTLLLYGALGGVLFFVPFNLIQVQGYSSTEAGFVFLPMVLTMFLLSRWSGGIVGKYGAKLPLIIGPLIAAAGFALFALPDMGGSYWTTYFPAIVVLGLGMSITVAPLTTAVMNSVDVSNSGVASGINNAVSRVAGLLAIATLGIVMLGFFSGNLDHQLAGVNVSAQVRQSVVDQKSKLTQIELPKDLPKDSQTALKSAIDEAFVGSFRIIMLIGAGMALLSAIAAFILVEGKPVESSSAQSKPKPAS